MRQKTDTHLSSLRGSRELTASRTRSAFALSGQSDSRVALAPSLNAPRRGNMTPRAGRSAEISDLYRV